MTIEAGTLLFDAYGNVSHRNTIAFLDMIAYSEIGPEMLSMPETDQGYRVCVGSTPHKLILFDDYSRHPRRRCDALNSDAAGRYQVMGRFFEPYRKQLGLPDFGPQSQDRIALQMLRECHAVELIGRGQFAEAVSACKSRWASLPGAGYSQRENALQRLMQAYMNSGGAVS